MKLRHFNPKWSALYWVFFFKYLKVLEGDFQLDLIPINPFLYSFIISKKPQREVSVKSFL